VIGPIHPDLANLSNDNT